MSEYIYVQEQTVPLNQAAIFNNAFPCSNGAIWHENGSGIFVVQGIVFAPWQRGTIYSVYFNGNIALPEGATVTPIAVAITVNGEPRPASTSIITPAAAESFQNITSIATIPVPRGRTFTISVRAVAPPTDLTETPAPAILLRNANLRIFGQVV